MGFAAVTSMKQIETERNHRRELAANMNRSSPKAVEGIWKVLVGMNI